MSKKTPVITKVYPENKIPALGQSIFISWWWMQLMQLAIWPIQFIPLVIGLITGLIWKSLVSSLIIYLIGYWGNWTIDNVRSERLEDTGRTVASISLGYLVGNLLLVAGYLIKKFLI